jgi:ketosteroid isomerase-like protein
MTFSIVLGQEKNKQDSAITKAEQEVLAMEKQWNDARAKTDRDAFSRLIADDFVAFAPQDQVGNKAGVIKNYRAPNLEAIESGEVKVRIYGDTAVVTGWNIRKWRILDREKSPQERFTNVWVKRDGKWQIVSSQWAVRKEPEFKAIAALGCDQEASLKSTKSDTPAFIQFTNSTNQTVIVHWINFDGKRDTNQNQIQELKSGQSSMRGTFLTHPFVVTNESGKCLGVYQPMREAGIVVIK